MSHSRRQRVRIIVLGLVILVLAATLAWTAPYNWMRRTEASKIYNNLDLVPTRPVAIVFGALVYRNGHLSPVLRGRVDAAIDLYRAGKVEKLLMSGDNGRVGYDEVSAMKAYAVSRGVPPEKIVRDFAGFRTLDSCYRARHIFDVRSAILVTQAFHLPRALYLAHHFGIDAVGFVAPDNSSPAAVAGYSSRETNAAILALIDVNISRTMPKFEGRIDPILSDDRPER